MEDDPTTQESVVVAAYPNRHDAEIAKAYLEEEGIDSFISADDVHTVVQYTQGARLTVLAHEAARALEALQKAALLPSEARASHEDDDELDPAGRRALISNTAWMYIIVFTLMVLFILFAVLYP